MWHRFKNLVFSLKTYDALSPDLKVRQHVNQFLRQRPSMSCEEWFQTFYQLQGVSEAVVSFVYKHFGSYSGLEFGSVLPTDRLEKDLYWTQVCWFDWELSLYDDFWQTFGVDISDCWDETALETINDLVLSLDACSKQIPGQSQD